VKDLLNFGQMLSAHARITPSRVGARDLDRSMTFKQWNERSCQLANALLGPIGLIISGIVSSSMEGSVQEMKSMTSGLAGKGMTFGTGGLGGAKFDDVVVSPESLTLHGFAPTISMPLPQTPGIRIEGKVATDSQPAVYPGTYTIPSGCLAGIYRYRVTVRGKGGEVWGWATAYGQPGAAPAPGPAGAPAKAKS